MAYSPRMIEIKQTIYEELMEYGCPDLLAALIVKNDKCPFIPAMGVKDMADYRFRLSGEQVNPLYNFISGVLDYSKTKEGFIFWFYMTRDILECQPDLRIGGTNNEIK